MKKTAKTFRSNKPDFYQDKTFEQKLLDVLLTMAKFEWFRIDNRADFEKISETVKGFIDAGYPFEFDDTYTKIRRITNFE